MTINPWLVAAALVVAYLVFSRLRGGGKVASNIVLEKIKAGATVVDVRTPEEYRGGFYPGAVNIPVQALAARMGEIPKEKPVVVYCASGGRSGVAASMLKRAGYADVVNGGGLPDMPR
jgi:phage shock protein E